MTIKLQEKFEWDKDEEVEKKEEEKVNIQSPKPTISTTNAHLEYNNIIAQNVYDNPKGIIIGTIPVGKVKVLEIKDKWAKIDKGYIQMRYLKQ